MRNLLIYLLLFTTFLPKQTLEAQSNSYVIRDIKSFGAKGDGTTNDHEAFLKAALFFNKRGGNGKLTISKGIYKVGKQVITSGASNRFGWDGQDVLYFYNVENLAIEGAPGAVISYIRGLKFGSFDKNTGKAKQVKSPFVDRKAGANIGHCIYINHCKNVTVANIELDGNSNNLILGGPYGDKNWQLHHYGILIADSRGITIQQMNVHHFGLDGIYVANSKSSTKDVIKVEDSKFNYNARQGMTWAGGNDLIVRRCQFNHTGRGKFASAPAAGLDIEAEYAPVSGGKFEDCEFVDAVGSCLVANAGDVRNVTFSGCTFWSSSTWSIWVEKPGFNFINCKIYGSVVHGYDANTDQEATRFSNCYFEDRPYKGKLPPEGFLVESNHRRRMRFENCDFVANTKKLFWLQTASKLKADEKYQLINCTFKSRSSGFQQRDFIAVMRGVYQKNTIFLLNAAAKTKAYYIEDCCEKYNIDGGGNKITYE